MNERLSKVLKDPKTITIGVGMVSFAAGVGVGYILSRKKVEVYEVPPKVDFQIEDDDLVALQDEPLPQPDEVAEGTSVVEKFIAETIIDGREVVLMKEVDVDSNGDEVVTEERNIFTEFAANDDDWDYDEELKNRTRELPYVIHKDEFYEDEKDYVQSTFTYYAGDDILVDEDEVPIYNHHLVVGGELLFGHGSGDPNVVHIRNENLNGEYEVIRDPGLYSVEVGGLELEKDAMAKDVQHSRLLKFRDD